MKSLITRTSEDLRNERSKIEEAILRVSGQVRDMWAEIVDAQAHLNSVSADRFLGRKGAEVESAAADLTEKMGAIEEMSATLAGLRSRLENVGAQVESAEAEEAKAAVEKSRAAVQDLVNKAQALLVEVDETMLRAIDEADKVSHLCTAFHLAPVAPNYMLMDVRRKWVLKLVRTPVVRWGY